MLENNGGGIDTSEDVVGTPILLDEVKAYLRLLDDEDDLLIEQLIASAVMYITNHTGLDEDVVKTSYDFKQAIMILCSDFYWNRDYQTSNKYVNKLVDNIIENNRINFF